MELCSQLLAGRAHSCQKARFFIKKKKKKYSMSYYTLGQGMTMATLPPGSSPLVRLMIVPLSAITHPKFALNATHRDFLLEQQAAFASADPAHDDLWVAAKILQVLVRSSPVAGACTRTMSLFCASR